MEKTSFKKTTLKKMSKRRKSIVRLSQDVEKTSFLIQWQDGAGCHPVTFLNFENHPTPFLMHILGWDAIPVHNQLMEILFYFPPINKLVKTILKFAAICEFK